MSFVHFYYKHECKLIFKPKSKRIIVLYRSITSSIAHLYIIALDLVGVAKGYALPHLPRMPELRGLDTSSFSPHPSTPREIRYKDKTREKQRRLKLEKLDQGGMYSATEHRTFG